MPNIIVPRPRIWKPPAGSLLDLSHPLAQGLIGSWDMLEEGSSVLRNSLQHGSSLYDAIANGNQRWDVEGLFSPETRMAPIFNRMPSAGGAGTDFYNVTVAAGCPFDAVPFSIECWFRTPVGMVTTGNPWCWGRDNTTTRNGWEIFLTSGAIGMSWGTTASTSIARVTPVALVDGNWHHFTASMNETQVVCAMYDGIPIALAGGGLGATNYSSATTIRWGKSVDGFWGSPASGFQWGPCRWRNKLWNYDEMLAAYQNPYGMFRGPEVARRYWYFRTALVAQRRRQSVIG